MPRDCECPGKRARKGVPSARLWGTSLSLMVEEELAEDCGRGSLLPGDTLETYSVGHAWRKEKTVGRVGALPEYLSQA